MENAILYAGVEELNTIKEHVMELNGYQDRNAELIKEEVRLEKMLSGKEKELADEIENTLKKRKASITASYEGQLSTLNTRKKKIKVKKDKAKGIKVSERISEETAELREANKSLQIEIKANLKKDKTPGFCNTTLFYAFFLPKTLTEFLIVIAGILLIFLALPLGLYQLFLAEEFGALALAIVYIAEVVIFGGLYLILNNTVKEKHLETLKKNRALRQQYKANARKIREIQKDIERDTDESAYGLEQYDDEMKEIEEEIRRVAEEEKEELTKFENVTSLQLKDEIKNRYQAELDALKEKCGEVSKEQKKAEEKVKEFTLMLSKQYETYLGKDVLTVEKLDRLIKRIEQGEAANIGEALNLEKQTK